MPAKQTPPGLETGSKSSAVRITLGKNLISRSNFTLVTLWALTLLLTGFGLIMVLSSSSITSYLENQGFLGGFWRQTVFAAIGIPLMVVSSRMPLLFWKKIAWPLFGFALVLQLLVFTPLGVVSGGNRNWLELGPISGQPSELLKLALIIWMGAVLLAKERLLNRTVHALIPAVFPGAALALFLVLLGGDLGTGLVMFGMVIASLYFSDVNWKALAITISSVLIVAVTLLVSSPNRMRRVLGLTGAIDDYSGHDWQPLHALWALAGGGVFGVGLGSSKAKWSWLPEADNDYIFAIIGEELGMLGAVLVIMLYVALAFTLLRVIAIARDRFGRAVVGSIMVWIIGQAFINIGVVVRLLPVIGVPLPLISAGGTALIACLIAMGVVIGIAKDGLMHQEELRQSGSTAGGNNR